MSKARHGISDGHLLIYSQPTANMPLVDVHILQKVAALQIARLQCCAGSELSALQKKSTSGALLLLLLPRDQRWPRCLPATASGRVGLQWQVPAVRYTVARLGGAAAWAQLASAPGLARLAASTVVAQNKCWTA